MAAEASKNGKPVRVPPERKRTIDWWIYFDAKKTVRRKRSYELEVFATDDNGNKITTSLTIDFKAD